MSMNDPLADMLTRIRNGQGAHLDAIEIPLSKIKVSIAEVLKQEGYIENFNVIEQGVQGALKIDLKYDTTGRQMITGIKRISKPGLRQYKQSTRIPIVMSGLGIGILSTSKGLMTDREARRQNIGGELLCEVW